MNYHNVANNSISKILNSVGLETDKRPVWSPGEDSHKNKAEV